MTARDVARCPDDNTLGLLVAGELSEAERGAAASQARALVLSTSSSATNSSPSPD